MVTSFTERTRRILALAGVDAKRRGLREATPLNLFVGVLDEGGSVAISVMRNARVPLDELRVEVESRMPAKDSRAGGSSMRTWSDAATAVLNRAAVEASEMGQTYVGTQHLLLALLHDPAGEPAQAFRRWGFDREAARVETLRVLGPLEPHRG